MLFSSDDLGTVVFSGTVDSGVVGSELGGAVVVKVSDGFGVPSVR